MTSMHGTAKRIFPHVRTQGPEQGEHPPPQHREGAKRRTKDSSLTEEEKNYIPMFSTEPSEHVHIRPAPCPAQEVSDENRSRIDPMILYTSLLVSFPGHSNGSSEGISGDIVDRTNRLACSDTWPSTSAFPCRWGTCTPTSCSLAFLSLGHSAPLVNNQLDS